MECEICYKEINLSFEGTILMHNTETSNVMHYNHKTCYDKKVVEDNRPKAYITKGGKKYEVEGTITDVNLDVFNEICRKAREDEESGEC